MPCRTFELIFFCDVRARRLEGAGRCGPELGTPTVARHEGNRRQSGDVPRGNTGSLAPSNLLEGRTLPVDSIPESVEFAG
jgi:hypothetical protein